MENKKDRVLTMDEVLIGFGRKREEAVGKREKRGKRKFAEPTGTAAQLEHDAVNAMEAPSRGTQ